MRNSTKSIKRIFLATAAIAAFAVSPSMAEDENFVSGAQLSRQIVVQEKEEVKNLVAKLKDSQDALDQTLEFRAPKIEPKAEVEPEQFAGADQTEVPLAPVEEVEKVEEPVEEDAFELKTLKKAKTHKVKMPTVFTAEQIELYEALNDEEKIALVRRLAKKYGLSKLYPTKQATNNYNNSYSQRHNSYSNSYSHNNYSSAYSTSNYSAGGCKN